MARLIRRRCLHGGAPTPTEVISPQINSAQSTSMWTSGGYEAVCCKISILSKPLSKVQHAIDAQSQDGLRE